MPEDNVFQNFKQRALPIIDAAIETLGKEFPNVQFSRCEEQKQISLSALIMDAASDIPDLVDLVIAIYDYKKTEPIIDADVVWGDGCGCIEGRFSEEEVPLTEANLDKVYRDLPRLISILKTAVERRKPYNWIDGVDHR